MEIYVLLYRKWVQTGIHWIAEDGVADGELRNLYNDFKRTELVINIQVWLYAVNTIYSY